MPARFVVVFLIATMKATLSPGTSVWVSAQ
jgi:hypothetical protein